MGSLAAPNSNALLARASSIPSNSNSILPGLILHAQYSGVPFPLPILTSVGFWDTGTSGKASRFKVVRKEIARINTFLNLKRKKENA